MRFNRPERFLAEEFGDAQGDVISEDGDCGSVAPRLVSPRDLHWAFGECGHEPGEFPLKRCLLVGSNLVA